MVNKERKRQVEDYMREHLVDVNYRVVIGHAREVMTASDAVLLASGTATLEAMLCKRPMVVAYRMSWLTHQMMKRLYIAKYFALPNILADEELVPELLQEDVNPQNIAIKLLHYFNQNEGEKAALVARFTELHGLLKQDADAQAAKAVLSLIAPNQESK